MFTVTFKREGEGSITVIFGYDHGRDNIIMMLDSYIAEEKKF